MRTAIRFESLEFRVLFAVAPPTIIGLSADVRIISGTDPFASSGEYVVHVHSSGRTYDLEGDANVADSSGSYSYSPIKSNIGRLTGFDALLGNVTVDFQFATSTTGLVTLTRKSGGSQTGTFILTGPNFSSVSKGVLSIAGTDDGDAITAAVVKSQVIITRNNITQKFTASSISQMMITSGAGNDSVDASTINVPIYVDAGAGNDNVSTGNGNDTITGGAGKNVLMGNNGNDRINGSGSLDSLFGGAGNDRLYGNGGDDNLNGGAGVDRLFGGDGNDLLIGGSSNDKLYGEAGNDTLNGQGQADLNNGGPGTDTAVKDVLDSDTSIETLI
jgi:Ca2+-binding RTX toxin-like protein